MSTPQTTTPVHLSAAALARARRYLDARSDAAGLRIAVRRTGCSGWGYTVDIADSRQEGDTEFEQDGVRLLVDPQSLTLIAGTEVDFVRDGLNQQFVFRNPNAVAECGCGESFTTAPPE